MMEGVINRTISILLVAGLPALFVLFLSKGALVGKFLPTTVLLPGYVLATSASQGEIFGAVFVSSGGYLTGQLIIYYGAQRGGRTYIDSSPRISISANRLNQVASWFERYGGTGIFVSGVIPYLRGLIMIPAGILAILSAS